MARILLTTFGSLGDLFPYLAVGIELKRRGHAVTVASSPVYAARVAENGLDFHPVRPDLDPTDRKLLAEVMDARRGTERVLRFLSQAVRQSYEDTLPAVQRADIVLTHPITFGSVLAAEKAGVPWVSSVLAPISFLSAHDPPVPSYSAWILKARRLGPGAMRAVWNFGKTATRPWLREVVELRRELGLPADAHPLFGGSDSPLRILALFSKYLAEPQPDWPPQAVVTGFPFYDRGEAPPPELEKFLAGGPPPVVFTLGSSAVEVAGAFYRESIEAVERIGARAILMVGRGPQDLPSKLPDTVLALTYAPHTAVMPRGAATVHQGGIGTTAQAMRAGKPMLVVPFGHDQFDNANRVKRLGVAETLDRRRYSADRVAPVLRRLLTTPSYAQAAAELGARVHTETGAATAAEAIEQALESRHSL